MQRRWDSSGNWAEQSRALEEGKKKKRRDLNGSWKEGAFPAAVTALSPGAKVVRPGLKDDMGCPDRNSYRGSAHSTR